uniref:C2 NT-type domain-containing protein n=1 Tax=Kalanchoe fedtschenkoi TaxID=63787 RepID=A0A7N0ZXU7_KALFE
MMTSASESGKRKGGEDAENGKLLNEIEAISKALYLDSKDPNPKGKIHARSASVGGGVGSGRSGFPEPKMTKSANSGLYDEEPKKDTSSKSFWNWKKPLKALSHIRNKRFNCCFSLIVHSIEGLPNDLNYASLRVHWKRRDGEVATECAKVVDGVAEFDQRLTHTCSVYGSRSGPHHSAKYEAKHFLLYATLFGSPEVELGKHRIDLTRLLPLTLEELEEEKSYGRWTTNFKLSGKAKGAMMHVSFGYSVVKDNVSPPHVNNKFAPGGTISKQSSMSIARYGSKVTHNSAGPSLRRTGSLPSNPVRKPLGLSGSVEDIKVMHEVSTTSSSETPILIKMACRELDKENLQTSVVDKPEVDVFTVNLQPPDHTSLLSDTDKEKLHKEREKNEMFVPQHGKGLLGEEPDEDVEIVEAVKILEASSVEEASIEGKPEKNELSVREYGKKSLGMDPDENGNSTADVNIVEGSAKEEAIMEKESDKRDICLPERGTELLSWEADKNLSRLDDIQVVAESSTAEANVVKHVADPTPVPLEVPTESLDEILNDQLDCHLGLDDAIKDHSTCSKTVILQELQSAMETVTSLELAGIDSPEDESRTDDIFTDDFNRKGKSISFDDESDLVAHEFLNLLQMEDSPVGFSSESEPDSPRERLLRQFEKDALADGFPLFDYSCFEEDQALFEAGVSGEANLHHEQVDFELSSMILAAEEEFLVAIESEASKTKAKMLEDLETEHLMREMGLNEKAFDRSPSPSPRGFGGRDCLLDDPSELPSLGEGLGPFIQTKNGGYIRSMNPSIFENSKSGGSLIMQVSSPVVVPAEMGSDVMEILQGLASIGIEKLSIQANKLMPLEDITGKTLQQIAWEASPTMDATESQRVHRHEEAVTEHMPVEPRRVERQSYKSRRGSVNEDMRSEYVSLEDLAPLAMDKIEALSMEGLRIQAGMSNDDAPSNISSQSIGDISALKGEGVDQRGSLGMDGTAGLQLVDVRDRGEDVDGLMSLSVTLDEWMKLDSGDFDDNGGDQISERTSKILAAHHANSLELIGRGSKGDKRRGKGSNKKCGLLGNNFTVALLVQLRDPLRNYEPVGTPMLALIQVERVFVPGKPRIFSTVSQVGNCKEEEEADEGELAAKAELGEPREAKSREEEGAAHYKITEVHVAGLKVDSDAAKRKLWGSKPQQQSGSRWLAANGMGKPNKHPLLKSKPAAPAGPRDSLWSISSLFWGRGAKSQEPSDSSSLKRNANIVL